MTSPSARATAPRPPTAADPRNGIDDDLDGRESAALRPSTTAVTASDNDGAGGTDGAEARMRRRRSTRTSPWLGDVIAGNARHRLRRGATTAPTGSTVATVPTC